MHWIAPSEKDTATDTLEKRLWDAADQFRANSGLKSQEYSAPVLGLIFLRFTEVRFAAQRVMLELPSASGRGAGRHVRAARCHTSTPSPKPAPDAQPTAAASAVGATQP